MDAHFVDLRSISKELVLQCIFILISNSLHQKKKGRFAVPMAHRMQRIAEIDRHPIAENREKDFASQVPVGFGGRGLEENPWPSRNVVYYLSPKQAAHYNYKNLGGAALPVVLRLLSQTQSE